MSFGSSSLSLQRKRGEANVISLAAKGASCKGEMELQCKLFGELQKGCIAIVQMPGVDGKPSERIKVTWRVVEIVSLHTEPSHVY